MYRAIVRDTPNSSIYNCINENRELVGVMRLHKTHYKEELALSVYSSMGLVPPGYRIIKDEGANLNYPINCEIATTIIKDQTKGIKFFGEPVFYGFTAPPPLKLE